MKQYKQIFQAQNFMEPPIQKNRTRQQLLKMQKGYEQGLIVLNHNCFPKGFYQIILINSINIILLNMNKLNKNQLCKQPRFQLQESAAPFNSICQQEIITKKQKKQLVNENNISFEFNSFENSFEIQGNQHPEVIFSKFQKYIGKVLKGKQPVIYTHKKPQNISSNFKQLDRLQQLQELLNKINFTNKILTSEEKKQFNVQLSRQGLLTKTVQELYIGYQQALFLQFYRAILIIWKKFYIFAQQFCSLKHLKAQFPCVIRINSRESFLYEKDTTLPYSQISQTSILQECQKISFETINELYNNSHLKLLKVEHYKPQIASNVQLDKQFGVFAKILIKSVFLCSVEIYEHPDSQTKTKINTKVEFQDPTSKWSSILGYNQSLQTDSYNSDSSHDL